MITFSRVFTLFVAITMIVSILGSISTQALANDPPITDTDGDGIEDAFDNCFDIPNPDQTDTNGDGYGDACDLDDDNDGLLDAEEIAFGSNPLIADSDYDGLNDAAEYAAGTNPNNNDSDGDGLSDGLEVNQWNTDPLNPDTDGDGLLDGEEANTYGTNPRSPDADGDGLNDYQEVITYGTNPNHFDTDGDGIHDNIEIAQGTNPLVADADSDGDGIVDALNNCPGVSNALQEDTDGDGIGDACEIPSVLVTFQVIDGTTNQPMPFPGMYIHQVLDDGSYGPQTAHGPGQGSGEDNSLFEISLPAGVYGIGPWWTDGHVAPQSFVLEVTVGMTPVTLSYFSNSALPGILFQDASNDNYPLNYPDIVDACVAFHEGTPGSIGAWVQTYCDSSDGIIDGGFNGSIPVLPLGQYVAVALGVPGHIAPAPFAVDATISSFTMQVIYERISVGGPYLVTEGNSVALSAAGRSTLNFSWDLDNNGTYEFSGQSLIVNSSAIGGPGEHTIRLLVCNEYPICGSATTSVTVEEGDSTGTISALVQDATVRPAEAVQVGLYTTDTTCDDANTQLGVQVTDTNGIYQFGDIAPGDYCVMLGWYPDWFGDPDKRYQSITISEGETANVTFTFATYPTPPDPGTYGLVRLNLRTLGGGLLWHMYNFGLGGFGSGIAGGACVTLSEPALNGQTTVCDEDHYSGLPAYPDSTIDIYVESDTLPAIVSYAPPLMW